MTKEELIKDTLRYIEDDVINKEFLTYQEQDEWEDYLHRFGKYYAKLEESKLQERIDKAIEYIEHEKYKQTLVGVYTKDIHKNLLRILKGEE